MPGRFKRDILCFAAGACLAGVAARVLYGKLSASKFRGEAERGHAVNTDGVFVPGRVAVITGAASGIGLAVARKLAAIGMKLVLADIDATDLRTATRECCALAANGASDILAVRTDVSRSSDIQKLKEDAYEKFGEVAFLMNNAAIQNNGRAGPYEFPERWHDTLAVNLWGVIHGCQTFVPAMLAQGTPCIVVNTGSKQGITFPPGDTAYNVSKVGVKCLTEALQHKLRSTPGSKINAFLLVPGWTISMIGTKANQRLQGDSFNPLKAQDERSYDGDSSAAAIAKLEARGAWRSEQVADYLLAAVRAGRPFHIICPDNETSTELDHCRIQWQCDDILFRRVPLSRWSEQYKAAYKAVSKGL